jgi:VanZ family protein
VSRLATWLPPIAWTVLVLSLSSGTFSADNTGGVFAPLLGWLLPWVSPATIEVIHGLVRKAAHVTEYAVLAALWLRAFSRSGVVRPPSAAWLALIVSVAVAMADEIHQATVPSRTGSARDVVIDTLGAVVAVVPGRLGLSRAAHLVTGLLLWIGAVGGVAALGLGLAVGEGGGVLWLTVPVAALALAFRSRKSSGD